VRARLLAFELESVVRRDPETVYIYPDHMVDVTPIMLQFISETIAMRFEFMMQLVYQAYRNPSRGEVCMQSLVHILESEAGPEEFRCFPSAPAIQVTATNITRKESHHG